MISQLSRLSRLTPLPWHLRSTVVCILSDFTIIEIYYLCLFILYGGMGYQWCSALLSAARHASKTLKYIMHILRGIKVKAAEIPDKLKHDHTVDIEPAKQCHKMS